jgi:hypothetical protein
VKWVVGAVVAWALSVAAAIEMNERDARKRREKERDRRIAYARWSRFRGVRPVPSR